MCANEQVERRKHKRYRVDSGALALLGWYYETVGRIIDISMGGLAFRYMPHENTQEGTDLTIVFAETNFYLDEVPTKTISDFELADPVSAASATARRRGVQFTNLTDNQKAQIKFFINNYTERAAASVEPSTYSTPDEPVKMGNGLPS